MRNRILFGSIFVLALILLMPSIPAIQQKTVEDKAYIDFIEKLEDINLEDLDLKKSEIVDIGDWDYPILTLIYWFFLLRANVWLYIAIFIEPLFPFLSEITFARAFMLAMIAAAILISGVYLITYIYYFLYEKFNPTISLLYNKIINNLDISSKKVILDE